MFPKARGKRKQVKTACIVCARGKRACDGNFPCGRCVRLGKEEDCCPVVRRKRTPRDDEDGTGAMAPPAMGAPQPPHHLAAGPGNSHMHQQAHGYSGHAAHMHQAHPGAVHHMSAQADGSGTRAPVHPASSSRVAVPRAVMMHDGRMVQHQMHPGMPPGMGFAGHGPVPMPTASSRMPTHHHQHTGNGLFPGHAAQYGHQMHHPHHQPLQYLPSQFPRMAPLPSAQDYALLSARPYVPGPSADVRAAAAALTGASAFASSSPPEQHAIRPPSMTLLGAAGAGETSATPGVSVGDASGKAARPAPRPAPALAPASRAPVRDGPAVRPPDISSRDGPGSAPAAPPARSGEVEECVDHEGSKFPHVVLASPDPTDSQAASGHASATGGDAPEKALSDRSQSSRADCRGPAAGGRMLTIGVGGAVPLMPADAASLCEALELAASLEKAPLAKAVEAIRDLPMPTVIVEYDDVSRLPLDAVPAMLATPHSDSQSMSSGPVAAKRARESFADESGSLTDSRADVAGLPSKRARPAEDAAGATSVSTPGERPAAAGQAAAVSSAEGPQAAEAAVKDLGSNGHAADSSSTCAERLTPSHAHDGGVPGARGRSAAAFGEAGHKDSGHDAEVADEYEDDEDDEPMQWAPIALESNDLAVRLFNNTRQQVAEDAKNGVELAWIHPHDVARRATVSIKANSRRMSQFTYDGLYISRVHPPPGQAVTKDGVALVPFATFRATEVMVFFYDGHSDRLKRSFTFWVGIVPTGSVLPAGTLVVPKHVSQSLESSRQHRLQSSEGEHGSAPTSPRLVAGSGGTDAADAEPSAVSAEVAVSRGEPFVPATSAPDVDAWALARSHVEQGHLSSEPGELPASMFAPGIQRSHPTFTSGYSTAMSGIHHQRPPLPRRAPYSDAMDADSGTERHSGLWAHSIGGVAGLFPLAGAMASVREHQLPHHFQSSGPAPRPLLQMQMQQQQQQQQMAMAQQQRQMNPHPGNGAHGHGPSHAQHFGSQGWPATR